MFKIHFIERKTNVIDALEDPGSFNLSYRSQV
jgi:hypothetical protein